MCRSHLFCPRIQFHPYDGRVTLRYSWNREKFDFNDDFMQALDVIILVYFHKLLELVFSVKLNAFVIASFAKKGLIPAIRLNLLVLGDD